MATYVTNRGTIIARVGLLGANIGIILGLFEACCLRLKVLPLPLMKPHVPFCFWFFAPLLTSVIFGLLGLLTGFVATLLRSRFPGMVAIAVLAGLMGDYFWFVLRFYPSAAGWFIFLGAVITPSLVFALVFACTLALLWATRRPGYPLGALADIPIRHWSWVVLGSVAVLVVAVGINSLPKYLFDSTTRAAGRSPSPNIILIVWDTTRADHFSSYGYFRNTTPHFDHFAQRGVLFENAISGSNWTLPAMAAVFTSLMPHQHGAAADTALGGGPRTLAEILGLSGYETAGFNANHYFGIAPWGLARGFKTYTDSSSSLGYNLDATRIGDQLVKPYTDKWFHRTRFNEFTAGQLNERIYRWFDHRSDRPYFLFLNYNDAHAPYEAPSPYNHVYDHESTELKHFLEASKLGPSDRPSAEREELINDYDQCLHYIDSQMEELLRFLQRSPEWSNTYVIITADHGEAFGEHNSWIHGSDLYREAVHVPLAVVGPGIPAGVRIAGTVNTPQIFSTVLEWAGMKQAVMRQSSLARMWDAHDSTDTPDEPALSEFIDATPLPARRGMISITTREWHFIYCADDHRNRLYHWPTDPLEQQNVLELPENQAIVEKLKGTLLSMARRSNLPWRDRRDLEALPGLQFSPEDSAGEPAPSIPGDPLFFLVPGAPQTLFPPNPETLRFSSPDEELLRSLPYNAR